MIKNILDKMIGYIIGNRKGKNREIIGKPSEKYGNNHRQIIE